MLWVRWVVEKESGLRGAGGCRRGRKEGPGIGSRVRGKTWEEGEVSYYRPVESSEPTILGSGRCHL